jgi:hypothetical protein
MEVSSVRYKRVWSSSDEERGSERPIRNYEKNAQA